MMKFTFVYITVLCLVITTSSGQQKSGLAVGDPAPPLNVYKWLKGEPVPALEKGKIYVIEFGSTWCQPCLKLLPKLTALANKYSEVTVISVFVMEDLGPTPEDNKYVRRVETYVTKHDQNMQYRVAVDDPQSSMEMNWLKAANKMGIPYTFVVDENGIIAWIGSGMATLDAMLQKMRNKEYVHATPSSAPAASAKKKNSPLDLSLLKGNAGTETNFLYRSMLSAYKNDSETPLPMFISSNRWAKEGSDAYNRRGLVNAPGGTLLDLYWLAYADTLWNQITIRKSSGEFADSTKNPYEKTSYGKYWYTPILEVANPSPFKTDPRSPENKFSYSLKVPPEKGTARFLQKAMQRDLLTYFGYDVVVETRLMPCWRLRADETARKKLATKTPGQKYRRILRDHGNGDYTNDFKNATMKDVISKLGSYFGYGFVNYGRLPESDVGPFFDETGITEEFDFSVTKAEPQDFNLFKALLARNGLYLQKSVQKMKVVVIRDPVP